MIHAYQKYWKFLILEDLLLEEDLSKKHNFFLQILGTRKYQKYSLQISVFNLITIQNNQLDFLYEGFNR